jgi:hypothetical protein
MAIRYIKASSEWMKATSASGMPTAWPITLVGWCKIHSVHTGSIFGFEDGDVANKWASIMTLAPGGGQQSFMLRTRNGAEGEKGPLGTTTDLDTTGATWYHVAGVVRGNTDRELYLDGVSDGTAADSGTFPSAVDVMRQGALMNNLSPTSFADVTVAYCGAWNVALSDPEIKALASGISPLQIRADKLFGFYPGYDISGDVDLSSKGNNFTTVGATPTLENHAPVSRLVPSSALPVISVGTGRLSGNVKESGTQNTRRLVRVYERSTGNLVGEVFSDETTGNYEITGLNRTKQYYAIVLDP